MVIIDTISREYFDLALVNVDLQSLAIKFSLHVVLLLLGGLLKVFYISFAREHGSDRVEECDIIVEGCLQ